MGLRDNREQILTRTLFAFPRSFARAFRVCSAESSAILQFSTLVDSPKKSRSGLEARLSKYRRRRPNSDPQRLSRINSARRAPNRGVGFFIRQKLDSEESCLIIEFIVLNVAFASADGVYLLGAARLAYPVQSPSSRRGQRTSFRARAIRQWANSESPRTPEGCFIQQNQDSEAHQKSELGETLAKNSEQQGQVMAISDTVFTDRLERAAALDILKDESGWSRIGSNSSTNRPRLSGFRLTTYCIVSDAITFA
ncbi:hypothetical protein FA15DRAFT_661721 [Coprinopsis marcescibilis]|uniref:Uncharacterized protein n=1 Tax=Coprinopsis marcescibilis TaxID=230819 RepID=A0A5C3KAY9_COPMA|nr:hypothetical protein FA15DRAFT_661721 [Coprinopsis marcescibilis]